MSFNRRSFIRYSSLAAAGHFAGLRPFGAMTGLAQSQSPNDYKALVCIFLYGGNDSNNMVVPFDTARYGQYAGIRGPLALPRKNLLPLTPAPTYALHPNMPDMQTLFNNGNAAILANVGTLVVPLTRPLYSGGQVAVPSNLFSHPDQQLEWQNAEQSGGTPTGWGGRIADKVGPSYNPNGQIPVIASVDSGPLFCNGESSSPVAVTPGDITTGRCSEGAACAGMIAAEQRLVTFSSGLSLVQADNDITTNADQYITTLEGTLQSAAPLQTRFPAGNGLAAQLKQIAQIMQVRQALGVNRQIFFAGLGGFDTHFNQIALQGALLAAISPAIASFYKATQELGIANQVTSFTMSDFSRALQPNSNAGSDHAWGGHHFIVGGAVHGGKIYGTYPTLALGGPDDASANGRWIPTTAVSQYASTLASWFGVPAADLPGVFPLFGHFNQSNLGFLG